VARSPGSDTAAHRPRVIDEDAQLREHLLATGVMQVQPSLAR
jgi:hypothetical protein